MCLYLCPGRALNEYSYCGNSFNAGSVIAPGNSDVEKGCSMTCNGNPNEYCGGPNRLTAYRRNTTSTTPGPASSTQAPSTPTGPVTRINVSGYSYQGCFTEGTNSRALSGLQNPVPAATLTLEKCAAACSSYNYFGTEYSGEWYQVPLSLIRSTY